MCGHIDHMAHREYSYDCSPREISLSEQHCFELLKQHIHANVIMLFYSLLKQHCLQHVGPTSSNIVVSNMLGPFEHHVGYCCFMLDDVGSSLILFKLFIQHRPTFDEKLVQSHRFHGDLH